MTVNLVKGAKVDLTKQAGGQLNKVRIGLGWDVRKTAGASFDLDAAIVVLDHNAMCIGAKWFVYYNNLVAPDRAIVHCGDQLTGAAEGDDETIIVDLSLLPPNALDLRIVVTIYDAKRRQQRFTDVQNAFVRAVDEDTGKELARYDLSEECEPGVNALEFAKLYKLGEMWHLRAVGQGYVDEMVGLTRAYQIPG